MSDKIIIKEPLFALITPVFWIVVGWGFVFFMFVAIYEGIVSADLIFISNAIFFSPVLLGILYLLIKNIGYFFNLLTFFVKNPYMQIDDDGIIINHYNVDVKPVLIAWSKIKAVFATKDFDNCHKLCVLYDKESSKYKNTNEYQKLFIHTKAIIYDDEVYTGEELFDCLCQIADEITAIKYENSPLLSATMPKRLANRRNFGSEEWRLVEPVFFPMLSLVAALICFYLGITFPLSKLLSQEVSLASIAPNLFFASIMILMGTICFNVFLKIALSLYSSKIRLDNQGIKIYQYNKSKQMLCIPWEKVYQARAEQGRHSYDVCIETLVYPDDDVVVTIKIGVYSLFPMLFPDYKAKALDIVSAINDCINSPQNHQRKLPLLYAGGYGQYSFLDVVPYE